MCLLQSGLRIGGELSLRTVAIHPILTLDRYLEQDPVLSFWPTLLSNLKAFKWSEAVENAVDHSMLSMGLNDAEYMAIHLRRGKFTLGSCFMMRYLYHLGDFSYHCKELAKTGHPFMLWNRLPQLPQQLSPNSTESERYLRCFPTREQILSRILEAKTSAKHSDINTIYVLHDMQWNTPLTLFLLQWLRRNLVTPSLPHSRPTSPASIATTPFERFLDTRDMQYQLKREEADFAVMVDVEIARRATIFVGNGFSSLTSDITMLRLADGRAPDSIGFW